VSSQIPERFYTRLNKITTSAAKKNMIPVMIRLLTLILELVTALAHLFIAVPAVVVLLAV
jgi:hypothetical protein